ncbi:hypothetical protein V8F20_011779 [Naviculisporaceae sp. PSN 640]
MPRGLDKFVTRAKGAFSRSGVKEQREFATDPIAIKRPTSLLSSIQLGSSSSATPSDKAAREVYTDSNSDIGGDHGAPSSVVPDLLGLVSGESTLVMEPRGVTEREGGDVVSAMTVTSTSQDVSAGPSRTSQAPRPPEVKATAAPTEKYGLFPFPPRTGAAAAEPQPFEASEHGATPSGSLQHVDIIVVHGVGGHWTNTWQASDGAVWPRDRIPALFSDTNIRCRIRSFGYNSASFLTRGDIGIRDCAKDLLDRIRVLRRKDTDEFRPIVFIAHSLGGILVKEALNRAWTRHQNYEDILHAVKGCIFLGVPHRGAAIATWAKHATQLTKFLTFGFAGNTSFLGTLEPDSAEWIRISDDFVDRGRDLTLYTFYETKKTGNLMVVDKASAIMHLPNEECSAVQGSDHRTIARFADADNERFSLIGDAVYNIVRGSLKGKNQAASQQTIIFDLPPASPHFFGRVRELSLLHDTLDPSKPGMKGVVLYGLAGSGKSQLVLNFIEACKARYTAIFWVNASTKETTAQCFSDIATCIEEMWPAKDLPNPIPRSATAEKLVLSRLRSTVYNRWLLVIDSADDAETTNFTSLVPSRCPHGSVIVTSTRRSAADQFEPFGFRSEEIDSLDNESAGRLLLHTSAVQGKLNVDLTDSTGSTNNLNNALKIVKELHGIPLALEQAGVLIRKQIVSFENFIEKYSKHYRLLMAKRPTPGATFYEKEHSVVAIISLLFSAVQNESPDSARLLQILCVLGRQNIPYELLKSLARSSSAQNPLAGLFSDDTILLMCISTLRDVCLVKLQEGDSRADKTISVHGLICRWVVDVILPDQLDDLIWIVEGILDYIQPSNDSPVFAYRPDKEITRRPYLYLLNHTITIAQDLLKVKFALPSPDKHLARINRKLAYVYLGADRLQDATRIFESCIELERETDPDSWPSTEPSLELLVGLAICRQKANDHKAAIEALESSLTLAESLFDYFDDRTAEISERLKLVSGRQEKDLQQHKAAVVASTGSSLKRERHLGDADTAGAADGVDDESGGYELYEEPIDYIPGESTEAVDAYNFWFYKITPCLRTANWAELRKLLKGEQQFDINTALTRGRTLLMHFLLEKTDNPAKILLDEKRDQINVEALDLEQQSALFYASLAGHQHIIRRLVKDFGADPNRQNIRGQTPLDRVLESHAETKMWIVQELIDLGANPDIPDHEGQTHFMRAFAANDLDRMRVFLSSGKVDINRQDSEGDSLLHRECADHNPSVEVMRQLVEWGADVTLKNYSGETPLHVLLSKWTNRMVGQLEEFCQVLLAPQSDINAKNDRGQTVLHLGASNLSEIDIPLLVNYEGADLNATDEFGLTPLMVAIKRSDSTAQVLLEHGGVDVNALDKEGKSALLHAIEGFEYWPDNVALLLQTPGLNLGCYGHGAAAQCNSILFAAVLGRPQSLRLLVKHSLDETNIAIKMAGEKRLSFEKKLIKSIGIEEHGRRAFPRFVLGAG